jgi:hypothetical protein
MSHFIVWLSCYLVVLGVVAFEELWPVNQRIVVPNKVQIIVVPRKVQIIVVPSKLQIIVVLSKVQIIVVPSMVQRIKVPYYVPSMVPITVWCPVKQRTGWGCYLVGLGVRQWSY